MLGAIHEFAISKILDTKVNNDVPYQTEADRIDQNS